jgi:hypothetical protein
MAQLAAAAVGLPLPTGGDRFNTTNEAQWLQPNGFQDGRGGPGDFRVGVNPLPGNSGHTAATLPGGEHAESGGGAGGFTVGPNAVGADSGHFPRHFYLPMFRRRGRDMLDVLPTLRRGRACARWGIGLGGRVIHFPSVVCTSSPSPTRSSLSA